MELFKDAKAVRLRSNHGKYLVASEDEKHVRQDRSGADNAARWTVEIVETTSMLRFKSYHGQYLTASGEPFLLGATGYKVLQTLPGRLGSSVQWEPIREGEHVKLKTQHGQFLCANGFLPPWRNSITHDGPRRTVTQDWVLWKVDVVDLHVQSTKSSFRDNQLPALPRIPALPRLLSGSPQRTEGRTIFYKIVNNINDGNGDHDDEEDYSLRFSFKGTRVAELTERLEKETGLDGILVFSRNPLGGKPYPMRLHLPNSEAMRVVVVPNDSGSNR